MAEMTTPIDFMHQLMYKLQYTYDTEPNKLNLALADLTDIAGLPQITDWTQLRDMIKADITTNLSGGGTAKDFLKNYCNIDLDNEDCGALIGFDCSGGEILTNDNIIDEQGELQTHPATADIRGCTVTFPTYSSSTYNYVMDGLYTWWIGLPFDLVYESYGLGFTEDSFVTDMSLDLFDDPPSGGVITGAYVMSYADLVEHKTIQMELCVNMNDAAFGKIIIGDKSGNTDGGWSTALDRVLAHELTHAVMSANIRGFVDGWLPMWFCEGGTAELVNGCDDSRTSWLLYDAVTPSEIDNGFSESPTNLAEYHVGFLAMRYLLKKYTDRRVHIRFPIKPKEPFEKIWEKMAHGIRSEHCISRDGDLNKIMDEFVDFVQRDDYNLVQPWTLCENAGSNTLRIPLEGHEKKTEDVVCTFNKSFGNLAKLFKADDAITISDTVFFRSVGESNNGELMTIPAFNFTGNGTTYPSDLSSASDYDVFIYHSNETPMGLGVLEDSNYFNWRCEKYNLDETPWTDIENVIHTKYFQVVMSTSKVRKNICVGISASTLFDLTEQTLESYMQHGIQPGYAIARWTKSVAPFGGVVRVCPLSCYKFGNPIGSTSYFPSFKEDFAKMIELTKDIYIGTYGYAGDYMEVIWDYYDLVGELNPMDYAKSIYTENVGGTYKVWDFDVVCSEESHRAIYPTGVSEHERHLNVGLEVQSDVPTKFIISKKQSTDFPCFYLSTGVFKPSMWRHEGLDYPTIAVDNEDDEYIPFNIHILNDYRMRFDLQGIGTCKKVTGKKGDANLLNGIRQTAQYSYSANVISDPIPGIGCPLIVRSVENKEDYNTILCYFTKTDYSGTFTLIFYDENDEEKPPVFQSVAFGLGISEEESYKYPLYTAGGSNGLYPGYYSFSYMPGPYAQIPVVLRIYGNKFNFDMTKGDTLDSLLYPVVTEGCGISNFRVLQPSGLWKSAINFKQAFYDEGKETCGAYITKNNGHTIQDCLVYPTISDITNVDRYTLVQPVTVIKKHIDGDNESGFIMSINGVKCKPDRLRSMITALDGHEYLIVPNGWYDRILGVPIRKVSPSEILVDVIMELLQKMPKQTYVLCIDLG